MTLSRRLTNLFSSLPFERIVSPPEEMDARLRARLSLPEAAGLLVACGFLASYLWMLVNGYDAPGDYLIYTRAAAGDTESYYYAYWMIPFFSFMAALPGILGYFIWSLLSILSVFFAARVFGGRPELVLISFQCLALLYFGQITGMVLGSLALFWWAIHHRRWFWAGLGLLIACTKFQLGIPAGLTLFLACEEPWGIRFKALIPPAVGAILSLALYPNWPLTLWAHIQAVPPDSSSSIAAWRLIGPIALLFWLPPLLLPLPRAQRIAALIAAIPLGLPYFLQADLVFLYAFPFGWLPLLGLFGLTHRIFTWPDYRLLTLVSLVLYLAALLAPWITGRRSD